MGNNITYPRFISNKPGGTDKFDGKSQEKLASAIASHIVNIDQNKREDINISRIIGLEGSWGSGKSNVIKLLNKQKDIQNRYYIFVYDAWGHQEDPQRRSFLENLTKTLIDEKLLSGNTELRIGNKKIKNITWQDKLEYLLAHKKKIETEKWPKLNSNFIAIIIAIILTPIFISIANINKIQNNFHWWWISFLLPFFPLIAVIIYYLLQKKGLKKILNEIVSIYNGEIENEIEYATISEREPSVNDFRNWMESVSSCIGSHRKKLILVYDDMDRLPADKVKELWASFHTFFSENGFDNIWVIIPFDKKRLSYAFNDSNNKTELTKQFINKTFPIVYRVTPPVITDFEKIFNDIFEEAFGNAENKEIQHDISRIFCHEKSNATIREIIEYINQLVALKNIWKDEIGLLYIAIFILKKDKILKIPVEQQILSGEYLGEYIPNVVTNDEALQTNIAALVYGVSCREAEQIPMSHYLDDCFNLKSKADINKYANSKHFISRLKKFIEDNNDSALLSSIIQTLSQLNLSNFQENKQKTVIYMWNILAHRKMKLGLSKQKFDNDYTILLQYSDCKREIINFLCEQIQCFKDFSGENYFKTLDELNNVVKTYHIDINIIDSLIQKEVKPKIFVDYVFSAKEKYQLYKLFTNPHKLSEYLSDVIVDKYSVLGIIKYLKEDKKYQFESIKTKIEEIIKNQTLISNENFKVLFDAYKILSIEKPLKVQLNSIQRQNIYRVLVSKSDTPEYLEICSIQIANGVIIRGEFNETQIDYIAKQMDYYAKYGDLLINNLVWRNPVLNQVLKYMTENHLGYSLLLEQVLPKFFDIKSMINVSESQLLEQFNKWERNKNSITKDNIQKIIPIARFFQYSTATKNNLTDYLNKIIIEALYEVHFNELQIKSDSYWYTVIMNLIDTEFLEKLSPSLIEVGKRYLDEIAASILKIPDTKSIILKIINKLESKDTAALIKDIRDRYCNGQYNITPQLFLFFKKMFETQGDLKQQAKRVTHKILEPIINDPACSKAILENPIFYEKIINNAEDDATNLKSKIRAQISNNSSDNKLISFAKQIGIEIEK